MSSLVIIQERAGIGFSVSIQNPFANWNTKLDPQT
jgi:hypothetical protein